jgi:hypothetical protein
MVPVHLGGRQPDADNFRGRDERSVVGIAQIVCCHYLDSPLIWRGGRFHAFEAEATLMLLRRHSLESRFESSSLCTFSSFPLPFPASFPRSILFLFRPIPISVVFVEGDDEDDDDNDVCDFDHGNGFGIPNPGSISHSYWLVGSRIGRLVPTFSRVRFCAV